MYFFEEKKDDSLTLGNLEKDCTDYNSKSCPKGLTIRKRNVGRLSTILMGCWGVYCWDGDVELGVYNHKKQKMVTDKEQFGQGRVVNSLRKYVSDENCDAIFLAGDNVYDYNIPKDKLLEEVFRGNKPDKKKYQHDVSISGQRIELQLSMGFKNCIEKVPVNDFFIAIGNHDVRTCHELNYQLNYGGRYQLPALYYNVVYERLNGNVNFIVLDTNAYSEVYTCNQKDLYSQYIHSQNEWVKRTLAEENATWNIIVGHIPYIANGHKDDDKVSHNNLLGDLFREISEMKVKVQAYMCADEHNQQFLYDKKLNMALVVAGSGGTVLDVNIQDNEIPCIQTYFVKPQFGFVNFVFERMPSASEPFGDDNLVIKYLHSLPSGKYEESFEVNINKKGEIVEY